MPDRKTIAMLALCFASTAAARSRALEPAIDLALERRAGERVLLDIEHEARWAEEIERPGEDPLRRKRSVRGVRTLLDEVGEVEGPGGIDLVRGKRTFRRYEIDEDGRPADPEIAGRAVAFERDPTLPRGFRARTPEGVCVRPALLAHLEDQAGSLAAFASLPADALSGEPVRANLEDLCRLLLDVAGDRRGHETELRATAVEDGSVRLEGPCRLVTEIDVDGVPAEVVDEGTVRLEIDTRAGALTRMEWTGERKGEGARGRTKARLRGTFSASLQAQRGHALRSRLRRPVRARPVPRAFAWLPGVTIVLDPAWFLLEVDDLRRRALLARAEPCSPDAPGWRLAVALGAEDEDPLSSALDLLELSFLEGARLDSAKVHTRLGRGVRTAGPASGGRQLFADRIDAEPGALVLALAGPAADARALERELDRIERALRSELR